MEKNTNDYHISFFKPTTPEAKANRNLTLLLVIIWAIAVFGFHIVLRLIEKPVPEPILADFEQVWSKVEDGSASETDMQIFAKTNRSVLSKVFIQENDKVVLQNALNWSFANLIPEEDLPDFKQKLDAFEQKKNELEDIADESYVAARNELSKEASAIIALDDKDIRASILPLELSSSMMDDFTDDNRQQLPLVMKKYLIHNRSVLTDTKFLGFPFHYFYSAVFLLILFVGLCWLYCVRTDAIHKRLAVDDNM
jgi:putative solute:sodium symporter small subunit